ncbi:N-acetyltransferase [Elongatibacter sediminis]|uniref:N-acetyltransferase n=1 Tax=Elongatibacter sediminis TaxID=3119006 RepID=A0AAW9R5V7_9GAMM
MLYHFQVKKSDENQLRIEAVSNRSSRESFIRVPWTVHAGDPCWVPPLLMERREALSPKNPFFEHADWQGWTAWRGNRAIGRISAQIDHLYLETHDPHTGFFGLLEAVDDAEVFAALFGAAETWLRERGMRRSLGPFNLGINQEAGLLVEGFDTRPRIMMPYGRPYYGPAVEALGYRKEQDLLAYDVDDAGFSMPEAMRRMLKRQSAVIRERPFERRHRTRDLGIMRDIFNDAWAGNWGFVPFTEAEFQAVGKELLMILPDTFIRIAEVDGEPAAFLVMLPDVNEAIADLDGRLLPFGWLKLLWRLKVRFPSTVRIALMGVRQKYQFTRLGPALAILTMDAAVGPARRRGVQQAEMSWILESNQGMRNIIERIGGRVTRRYRMYGRDLE